MSGAFAGLVISSLLKQRRDGKIMPSGELISRSAVICYAVVAVIGFVSMIVTTACLVDPIKYVRGPQLIMSTSTLDLGDVKWRKPIYASIWIGNSGSRPLTIDPNGLRSSCRCLGTHLSNSRIEPGNKEVLSVRVGPRPKPVLPPRILMRIRLRRRPVKALIRQFLKPLPSVPRFAATACLGLLILGVTTLALSDRKRPNTDHQV